MWNKFLRNPLHIVKDIKIHILYSSHVGSGIPARLLALAHRGE